ncbi:hypothetical protein WJ47_13195 [Burkholderia ubonensis]|uniref:Uncharacterized protein n=1 Tax=Burkholderia ubonensis TaxID=101571 RepID=A0AB73G7R3_9BURK|nr:hypothetical protein WI82_20535 [Burkholderia ubonensis]KVK86881.1 hypothetical protein WJ44_34110 [Burkholderia ubonensis]KVL65451.1 hypothetical protein WJ47_13195 [Burkholderia ubonensis]KVM30586.1 hypothetical protein WJ54_00515 [Burkholderia ubonensis]KVM36485.1 hypothetical protein WJ53_30945 [Burkholderia ubonensis]
MIFGFVAAIVVGFLLTAVRAWTSRETLRGASLAALWLLWAAGRLLALFGGLNVLFHGYAMAGREDLALRAAYAATGLILFFVAVITGRIVPMFTTNAIPGFAIRRFRFVDALAAPAVLLTLLAYTIHYVPILISPRADGRAD